MKKLICIIAVVLSVVSVSANIKCNSINHYSIQDLVSAYNNFLINRNNESLKYFEKLQSHLLVYHRHDLAKEDMETIYNFQLNVALLLGGEDEN